MIRRDTARPYHPATAPLAIEVSWSSLRRDLRRKAELYAEALRRRVLGLRRAGAARRRASQPRDGSYADVREVRAGERIADVQAGLPDLDVDELLAATYG